MSFFSKLLRDVPLSPASWHTPPCSPSPFGTSARAGSPGAEAAVPCRGGGSFLEGDVRPRGGEAGLSSVRSCHDEGLPGGAHTATLEQPGLRFGGTLLPPWSRGSGCWGTFSCFSVCKEQNSEAESLRGWWREQGEAQRCAGEKLLSPGLAGGAGGA